ncbi:peptidoglycan-binding protein [Lentilactobacillus fungorum]|uniref:Peptidoglycan-binding protein n=1 Tax=Lentilactobacillus fungorum TaxID=2201250 RepID=A0ABQ3VV40_9LACO|nr:LysM domain-containing protein [Lentilactobacillus fungorum]GHP12753.1 peptidoglycan-binding protein [Lentilactobacillus fungorum]
MNTNDPHKRSDDDQPWNQTFSEDRDENGHLSRVQLRKESQSHHLITIILVALISIVALAALAYGLIRQSATKSDSKQSAAPRVVRQESAKKKSSTDQSKVTQKKAKRSSTTAKQSDDDQQASVTTAKHAAKTATANKQSAAASSTSRPQTAKQASQQSSSQVTTGHKYATVKAGQGLYRVAVNHGISLNELLQLNGLTTNSAIHPGQRLRVK